MSHWVTYKNDVLVNTDISCLVKALEKMECTVDMNNKSIRNAYGSADVDFSFSYGSYSNSLGFKNVIDKEHNNVLELRGDFYMTGLRQSTFMNELSQRYQEQRILKSLESNQWSIENTWLDDDENIVIDAYQYVY